MDGLKYCRLMGEFTADLFSLETTSRSIIPEKTTCNR